MNHITAWWPGPEDLVLRAGQCYTLAMEMVLGNTDIYGRRLFLVHGLLHPDRADGMDDWSVRNPDTPLPPPNPHAWVEIEADDGVVACDPVVRMAWTTEEHRRKFGVEVFRRYRSDIAFACAIRNSNYGPWDRKSLTEHERRVQKAQDDLRYSPEAAIKRFLRIADGT